MTNEWGGTYHDSSFSTCPLFAWCKWWLMRSPWKGTMMTAVARCPTVWFRSLLSEKLP